MGFAAIRYQKCAVSYTDFWIAVETVFPSTRHRAVGFDPGQTNHIERLCVLKTTRFSFS